MQQISRKRFLKGSGVSAGALLLPPLTPGRQEVPTFPLHKRVAESRTICPYCSCGCGLLIATDSTGHILNSEGDPDHPNNRGALDPKSISVRQLSTSPYRQSKVMRRAPGASEWEEMTWEEAIPLVARRIKDTRDATFQTTDEQGVTVNRTNGVAFIGGAANNDEDCYIAVKLARALGLVYVEHQARI
jgi:formate dehydrogenase major subunit